MFLEILEESIRVLGSARDDWRRTALSGYTAVSLLSDLLCVKDTAGITAGGIKVFKDRTVSPSDLHVTVLKTKGLSIDSPSKLDNAVSISYDG